MAGFGNFTPLTWANGGVPAINDVNLQAAWDILAELDGEFWRAQTLNAYDILEYFFHVNCKEIDNFTDYAEYTAWASTTLSNDTTNNTMGKNAVKTLESDNTASFVGMWKNITSMNLETFNNGEASTADDIILLVFYISDVTKVSTVSYKFGDDNANNYNVTYAAATCSTGWNVKRPRKSDFATTGAPSGWNDITYIVFQWYSIVNSQNAYITFQYCQLCREDVDYAGYYNPFQKYVGSVTGWIDYFGISLDYIILYVDEAVSKLGFMKVNPSNNEDDLYVRSQEYTSFISKWEVYCKKAGYTNSFVWRVDANNYIETYISANVLYLDAVEGGVLTSQNVALSVNLALNERVELYFEKAGDSCKVLIKRNTEHLKELTHETTIADTALGYLYTGAVGTSSFGLVTDFMFSYNPGFKLEKQNTFIAVKQTASTINNSDAYTADPELYLILPRGLWEIEVNLGVYNATSNTPDFKTDWSLTNATAITMRSCSGPARAITDGDDTTMQSRRVATSLGIGYGVTSEYVNITEKAIIQVLGASGTVTLRRGQYTANASNTIVETQSYILGKRIR
jgi:hypothetical protein